MKQFLIAVVALFVINNHAFAGTIAKYISNDDKIATRHNKKVKELKAKYEKALSKINAETIKKYKVVLVQKTKAGYLQEALDIQKKIDSLKDESKISSDKEAIKYPKPSLHSQSEHKERIVKRYKEFYCALIKEKFDAAHDILDPAMKKYAPKDLLVSHLKLMSAHLKLARMNSSDIKTDKITLSKDGDGAKVVGKFRIGMKWDKQKPIYWILDDGEWYLGDDKQLKNFK